MDRKGPIAWMAQNSVAANLLMALVLAGGFLGLMRVEQEVFPEFEMDMVRVTVPYPGASPTEVEQGIVLAVEESVRAVDGVKRVTSASSEGSGTVAIELLLDANPSEVLQDVNNAVDRILTFPEEAEEPQVTLAQQKRKVVSLIVSGPESLRTLHDIAEDARARLLATGEVTQLEIEGVPPLEISIEVPRENLESYGLTLEQVAQQVRAASLELPGGTVETQRGQLLVRVSDRKHWGHEFSEIILRSTRDGASIRLGDVATVLDGYADTKQAAFFNGQPAVRLTAYRVGDETPQGVADAMKDFIPELEAGLPEALSVSVWDDDSELLRGRIDLLVRNARMGLVLVVGILALFLNPRLAFWVSLGIPISFMGAFLMMPAFDVSVNMITLFALIITLGMVVDDAIVVGENAYLKMQGGMEKMDAAIAGAKEMSMPVGFAILTSIAAFSPLFFVPGTMGKIFKLMPSIVVFVLLFSLIESFFVLPAHLAHIGEETSTNRLYNLVDAPRRRVAAWLERFIEIRFRPVLKVVVENRYLAMATAGAVFFVSIGMLAGGRISFSPMPRLEGDLVTVSARLPYGTAVERTEAVQGVLERGAWQAIADLGGPEGLVTGMYSTLGQGPPPRGPVGPVTETGSHLVTVELELVPSEEREVSAREVAQLWEQAVPTLAGVDALNFSSGVALSGRPVDIQLSHRDSALLEQVSGEVADVLRTYGQLSQVENGFASGKPQLDYQLLPAARTFGLTASDVARQIRSAFYGTEALREQRGRNEMKVMVRLPEAQRGSELDLEELEIRTPTGGFVPLAQVAAFERGQAPTNISREEGARIVNVTAELAPGVDAPTQVLENLQAEVLPELQQKYPGLGIELVGEQREFGEALGSLGQNYLFAIMAIYALLAVPFRSYIQPIIVMAVIPLGIVGAVWGHVLMGYELSLISIFGIVALSGVVVNDSLVLVDATNRFRSQGQHPFDAIINGAARRFRPILLTSLTTFFGLAPMIFETSMQARFLIPMAISLGYGILFATVVVLLLVPCLYMAVEDILALKERWFGSPEGAVGVGSG